MIPENNAHNIDLYLQTIYENITNGDSFNTKFKTFIKRVKKIEWVELWKQYNNKIDPTKLSLEEHEIFFASSFINDLKKLRIKMNKKTKINVDKLEITGFEIQYILFFSTNFNYFNWFLSNMVNDLFKVERNREYIYFSFAGQFQKIEIQGYELLKWIYNLKSRQVARHKLHPIVTPKSQLINLHDTLLALGHLIFQCSSTLLAMNIKHKINRDAMNLDFAAYKKRNIRSLIFQMIKIIVIQFEKIGYNKLHIQNPKRIQHKNLWRMKQLRPEKTWWDLEEIKEKKRQTWYKNRYNQ